MASTHDHDLVILMNAIGTSCKLITSAVQRAGVAKLYGLAGEVNSTGDDQKNDFTMILESLFDRQNDGQTCTHI